MNSQMTNINPSLKHKEGKCQEAFNLWLQKQSSPHTRRAYSAAWTGFLEYIEKPLWEVRSEDIRQWEKELRRQGRAETTISARMATLSSYFDFVLTYQEKLGEMLLDTNPVAAVTRPVIQAFQKVTALNVEQVRALLEAIPIQNPRRTSVYLRDYALILAYLLTGRRNSEVRELRWGQIRQDGNFANKTEKIMVRWSWIDEESLWDVLPLPVWGAISTYLEYAGRLEQMQESDYVFVALESPFGEKLNSSTQPLADRTLRAIVRRYAKRAFLTNVTVHTLRNTSSLLMMQAGANVFDLQLHIGHSRLSTTQMFLDQLKSYENNHWMKVGQMLGLPPENNGHPAANGNGSRSNGIGASRYSSSFDKKFQR